MSLVANEKQLGLLLESVTEENGSITEAGNVRTGTRTPQFSGAVADLTRVPPHTHTPHTATTCGTASALRGPRRFPCPFRKPYPSSFCWRDHSNAGGRVGRWVWRRLQYDSGGEIERRWGTGIGPIPKSVGLVWPYATTRYWRCRPPSTGSETMVPVTDALVRGTGEFLPRDRCGRTEL